MSQRDARLIGGIYRIGQILMSAGMLTTYTAYNRMTNDVVGLHVITFPPTLQMETVQQLLQPLEPRQSLQSPHVLRIHNWGVDSNRAYIATDPPRGLTLQHVMDTENIDLVRALDLTKQMAMGIRALHEKGIAGLDLRPQLITVDVVEVTDRVQIDDIGLRPLLHALGSINSQNANDIGYLDPRYVPPEYIQGGHAGPWSDVYQLGLLLFAFVTGRLPFVGRNSAETGILQSTSPIPRMTQFTHDAPSSIQEVIDCALSKEPGQRFASASALLIALEAIKLPKNQTTAEHPTTAQRTQYGLSGTNLTREMESVADDVTLRATLIEGHAPTGSAVSPAQNMSSDTNVYAYLYHEPKNSDATQRIAITQKNLVVGRSDPKRGYTPDIDLSTLDPKMTVSRQHARIRFAETFFYIEDLKSRNKTRLGELPLTPLKAELLQHGDIIHFGSVRMRFEISGMGKPPVFKENRP